MIIESIGYIEKIDVHNADDLCSNRHCSKKPEYYMKLEIGNSEYFLLLCNEHKKLIEMEK